MKSIGFRERVQRLLELRRRVAAGALDVAHVVRRLLLLLPLVVELVVLVEITTGTMARQHTSYRETHPYRSPALFPCLPCHTNVEPGARNTAIEPGAPSGSPAEHTISQTEWRGTSRRSVKGM